MKAEEFQAHKADYVAKAESLFAGAPRYSATVNWGKGAAVAPPPVEGQEALPPTFKNYQSSSSEEIVNFVKATLGEVPFSDHGNVKITITDHVSAGDPPVPLVHRQQAFKPSDPLGAMKHWMDEESAEKIAQVLYRKDSDGVDLNAVAQSRFFNPQPTAPVAQPATTAASGFTPSGDYANPVVAPVEPAPENA